MNIVARRTPLAFRLCVILFAGVLGLQAAWVLSAELLRRPINFFPNDTREIESRFAQSGAAATAAEVGWLRGDLWADYALSADSILLIEPPPANDRTKMVSEQAAALAPYDARLWLLLAAINAKNGLSDGKTVAQLKVSFYTAPNDIRLIPLRLRIATQSPSISDDELQKLIEHELRTALRKPELKPIIATAYRDASTAGRQFIETTLTVFDAGFLSELHARSP